MSKRDRRRELGAEARKKLQQERVATAYALWTALCPKVVMEAAAESAHLLVEGQPEEQVQQLATMMRESHQGPLPLGVFLQLFLQAIPELDVERKREDLVRLSRELQDLYMEDLGAFTETYFAPGQRAEVLRFTGSALWESFAARRAAWAPFSEAGQLGRWRAERLEPVLRAAVTPGAEGVPGLVLPSPGVTDTAGLALLESLGIECLPHKWLEKHLHAWASRPETEAARSAGLWDSIVAVLLRDEEWWTALACEVHRGSLKDDELAQLTAFYASDGGKRFRKLLTASKERMEQWLKSDEAQGALSSILERLTAEDSPEEAT